MGRKKRVSLDRLKGAISGELPEGHLYLLVVVDPKTGETRFTAPHMARPVSVRVLEDLLSQLKGTRLPVRSIHHTIPVITK